MEAIEDVNPSVPDRGHTNSLELVSYACGLGTVGSPARIFPLDQSQVQYFLDQTIGDDPQKIMWVAEWQKVMAATATTMMDWHQGVALLGFIAVAPPMRGHGIAGTFLREVISNTFKDERIARIELNVYTFNHGAMRTYEKLGFFKEGVIPIA